MNTALIPIVLYISPGITDQQFINKLKPGCQWNISKESYSVQGNLLNYPFPSQDSTINLVIGCQTPEFFSSYGPGTVAITINGNNFVGAQPVLAKQELTIVSISPQCGPVTGGTQVTINSKGFDPIDFNFLYFMWATTSTPTIFTSMMTSNNTFTTTAPAAQDQTTLGGLAIVVYSNDYVSRFTNGSYFASSINHIYSRNDFKYYTQPLIAYITPHTALVAGGAPVTVVGAYYFTDPNHKCTPKCKFGNILVEATYISSIQLQCTAPNYGSVASGVSFEISMNGYDFTNSGTLFNFVNKPVVTGISPQSGPSSGGTIITLFGSNFVDLSRYPSEFMCVFTSLNLNIPVKMTPAFFQNSSQVLCTSPGGWGAGNLANVEITYNGYDMTNSNSTFRFYQVDGVVPVSGPASGDSNPITIYGSGFINAPGICCRIGGVVTNATSVNWTSIQCPIPASPFGTDFFGKVDFYYTLNGQDWNLVPQGFSYYQQPVISSISPNVIPVGGGIIQVTGQFFRSDFYGAIVTCQLANTVVPANITSFNSLICPFGPLNYVYQSSSSLQDLGIALNNHSYTLPRWNVTSISIFNIFNIIPANGITDGGTLISVKGYGFVQGATPYCRFGIPGNSQTTYGTVITGEDLTCRSPPANVPAVGKIPFLLPFAVSFSDPEYNAFTLAPTFFRYYVQPTIKSISPTWGLVDHNVLITVTSDNTNTFGNAVVGGPEGIDGSLVTEPIACDFGSYGTSLGIYINTTAIQCLTPNTKLSLEDVAEDPVSFGVAINAQDFTQNDLQYVFTGTKSTGGFGIIWLFAILIGACVLVGMLYVLSKLFSSAALESPTRPRVSYEPRASQRSMGGEIIVPGGQQQGVSTFNLQVPGANVNRRLV
jgi:hypothetical protein